MTNTFKRPVAPVKIKQLHADAVIPKYARAFDAGFDLVAVEDVIILPGETAKIPTGLAFALPDGYELQVRPRSGISAKSKLRISNAPGTVDLRLPRGSMRPDRQYPHTVWRERQNVYGRQRQAG